MNRSKSGMFLMELILGIAFFAVISAMCIQIFATAYNIRTRSVGLQMAVINAQSAAEVFKATNGDADSMANLLEGTVTEGTIITAYDINWNLTQNTEDTRYVMLIETDMYAIPALATITVTDELFGNEIYSLTVRRYIR